MPSWHCSVLWNIILCTPVAVFVVFNLCVCVHHWVALTPPASRTLIKLYLIIYFLCVVSTFLFSLSASCSPSLRIGEISLKWYKVTSERLTHTHTHINSHSSRLSDPCSAARHHQSQDPYTHTSPVKHTHWHAQSHTQIHTTYAATHTQSRSRRRARWHSRVRTHTLRAVV